MYLLTSYTFYIKRSALTDHCFFLWKWARQCVARRQGRNTLCMFRLGERERRGVLLVMHRTRRVMQTDAIVVAMAAALSVPHADVLGAEVRGGTMVVVGAAVLVLGGALEETQGSVRGVRGVRRGVVRRCGGGSLADAMLLVHVVYRREQVS